MANQQSPTQDSASTHNTASAGNLCTSEENQDNTGPLSRIEMAQSIHFGCILTDEQIAMEIEPMAMNTIGSDDERGRSGLTQQNHVGQLEDILRDISDYRELLRTLSTWHPHRYRLLRILAERERDHFELSQSITSINDAINHGKDAVLHCSQNSDERSTCLGCLGSHYYFRFKRLGEIGDIDQAIECLRSSLALRPNWRVTRPELVINLASSWLGRFERLGDLPDLQKAIGLSRKVIAVIPDEHADKPTCLSSLGGSLMRRLERLGNLEDVDESIKVLQQAVGLTPHGHAEMPLRLNNLGNSLISRFQRLGTLDDVDEAIKAQQQAVGFTPHGHAAMPGRLSNLGISLECRFERLGNLDDVDRAIKVLQQAVELTPHEHADMPVRLNNLGISLMFRFERLGDLDDVDESIKVLQEAIELTPDGHADMPARLSNLGGSFMCRFERLGNLNDVDESIKLRQQAVELTPHGHAHKPMYFENLAGSFLRRFERLGHLDDVEESIKFQQQAVELTPPGHANMPGRLSNLGGSLMCRFERLGNLDDVDEAIKAQQQAVEITPHGHADMPKGLSNLGSSLLCRFQRLETPEDVDRSIKVRQQAVELTPLGHADMPGRLSNLGGSLMCRFQQLGNLDDVDESIKVLQQAMELTPDGHAGIPGHLSTLGGSLMRRFERCGNLDDVDEAIKVQQRAIELTPYGHADMPRCLSNLGASFLCRFERLGNLEDVDESIKVLQQAVELTPHGHAYMPRSLINLGGSLMCRFERLGNLDDVDESIKVLQQAVELTPHGHAYMPKSLINLGGSFLCRFERLGNLDDADESIKVQKQAVELTPNSHAYKPLCLISLGNSLLSRFRHSKSRHDLHAACIVYQQGAQCLCGPPSIMFKGAKMWAVTYHLYHGTPLLVAYETVLSLVPQIVWLGADITRRYEEIASIGDTVNDAAAAAISLDRNDLAVEWLEQGRSIVWGQILHLRTPLDDLKAFSPEFARHLTDVSHQLDTAGTSPLNTGSEPSKIEKASLEGQAQKHRRLAAEYEEILAEVRKLPGFESFLKPKQLSQLRLAAREGPVTMINLNSFRCDALVLRDGDMPILHIPLPELTMDLARTMQEMLMKRLKENGVRSRGSDDRASTRCYPTGQEPMQRVLESLWRTVVCPITVRVHEEWPDAPLHMTWCATGPLALLPLHAAGLYRSTTDIKLYDFTVSSYTPSLTMLIETHRQSLTKASAASLPRILAISQPNTPEQTPLPGTKKEVSEIMNSIADRAAATWLNDKDATVSAALEAMKTHSWCHFACHGIQHPETPTESAFMLHDGPLTLHTMMKQSFSSAQVAFLSACQTATGDERLTEESVHLAAGMLAAGYSTVFGTLWSIRDQDAPLVAKEVYAQLLRENEDDVMDNRVRGAYALHEATKKLRQEVGETAFVRWVPFVHFGL